MISEGSRDTEDWNNDNEKTVHSNKHYFYCMFYSIYVSTLKNAGLF